MNVWCRWASLTVIASLWASPSSNVYLDRCFVISVVRWPVTEHALYVEDTALLKRLLLCVLPAAEVLKSSNLRLCCIGLTFSHYIKSGFFWALGQILWYLPVIIMIQVPSWLNVQQRRTTKYKQKYEQINSSYCWKYKNKKPVWIPSDPVNFSAHNINIRRFVSTEAKP